MESRRRVPGKTHPFHVTAVRVSRGESGHNSGTSHEHGEHSVLADRKPYKRTDYILLFSATIPPADPPLCRCYAIVKDGLDRY